jgi:hypothetical protein
MKDLKLYISFIFIFVFAFVDYSMLFRLHPLSFDTFQLLQTPTVSAEFLTGSLLIS